MASIVGLGYFFSDDMGGRLAVENYSPYALTLGVMMVITIWWSAWGTQKEIPHLSVPAETVKRNPLTQMGMDAREAFRNHSFRWLFFGVLIVFVMSGVNSALDLYMFCY